MKTALVTGGTRKDVAAMAVLAFNIRQTNSNWIDEIVIFHDGIGKKDQLLMQSIFPIRFEKYRCPINRLKQMQNKSVRYFSPMVFCKFECFRLLEDYDIVMWSDYDVLIKEDISEIIKGEENLSIVVNEEETLRNMFFQSIEKQNMSQYDMEGSCMCTPLFVLKKGMNDYKKYYQWCYTMTKRYIKELYLPEQCIITMLVQKYKLPINRIDRNVYAVYPSADSPKVKILHSYGPKKFWSGLYNKEWNEYYCRWVSMGGRKYKTKCERNGREK